MSHFTVCSWRGGSCFWQTKVNLDSMPIVLSFFFPLSPQDDYPLASLPLLGYSVTVPSESENIHKDYVFKLHFKSHVYYFRSESEYTFERYGCTLTKRICGFVRSRMSEGLIQKLCSLPAGGWRSSAVPRSPPVSLVSWTTKSPILTEVGSPCFHTPSPSGGTLPLLSPPPPHGLSAFLFYAYLGHLYMCPCTFGAF